MKFQEMMKKETTNNANERTKIVENTKGRNQKQA